jgi:asparagine synthase (glutamine-hydrolysing)
MSGIVGYWAYASHDLADAEFSAFTHSLAHRGPDGFGIEHFPEIRLWLGHRHLTIHRRGRQPMSYGDGRYWLTCDGEIYNYIELREELRGLGHRFTTATVGEVILAAYAQWGADCLLRFNGMWAFAILDVRRRQLFLSRDRFGVKPLNYTLHNGVFAFASELKAFLVLPWIDGALDPHILREAIADRDSAEAWSSTLLPTVRRVPAGHVMVIEFDGTTKIWPWWNMLDHLPRPARSLGEQVEEFRALLLDACRLRLRDYGPVAVEQSGGVDSSALAGAVVGLERRGAIERQHSRRAFVACLPNTWYDERDEARIVIEHTGMAPHFENIDGRQAEENIEKIIFDHEVIWGFPRVAPWVLYRSMKEAGIRASLNGTGADKLMTSDYDFVELAADAAAARMDLRRYWELRRILRTLEGSDRGIRPTSIVGELRWFARRRLAQHGLLDPLRAARHRIRSLRPWRVGSGENLPTQEGSLLAHPQGSERPPLAAALDPRVANMSPLAAKLFKKIHIVAPTDLANYDRSSMAHGVEVRMPFMDWRVVTYCFALPETSRTGGGYTKRILRLAMEGWVPDTTRLSMTKKYFMVPLDEWARGALKPWLLDLCSSRSFLESPVWNGANVKAVVDRVMSGQASVIPIWPIINAHALERTFVARARAAAVSKRSHSAV